MVRSIARVVLLLAATASVGAAAESVLQFDAKGELKRPDDYLACETEYLESDGYRSFLHHRLRLRISCRRMRMAVRSFRPVADTPRKAG